jgi:hypothetical protein
MTQPDLLPYVAKLRDAGRPIFVAATGAGAGLQNILWSMPGSSAFLEGAAFTYSMNQLEGFVGLEVDGACSRETAILMALEAHGRAGGDIGKQEAIGLGLTATVATTREHRGDHRVHIATVSKEGCHVYSAIFEKAMADRLGEGFCCDVMGLNALLRVADLPIVPFYHSRIDAYTDDTAEPLDLLAAWTYARSSLPAQRDILFPGAFNPLHEGHVGIADEVEKLTKRQVVFALEASMPHKPPLSFAELLRRRVNTNAAGGRQLVITHGEPLYVDKAKRFDCDLVMGADALHRMLDPKWGPSVPQIIAEFSRLGTKVFVSDRDGFRMADSPVATAHPEIFQRLTQTWSQSSTAIRQGEMTI